MSEASPARGQSSVGQRNPAASMSRKDRSPVGNVGGAGSREPLQGRDGVCRRVSRGSARSLAHGAVRALQTRGGDAADGAMCSVVVHTRLFDGAKVVFFFVAIQSAVEVSFAAVIKLNRNETAVERLYVNRSVCETEGSSARPKCVRIRGLPPKTGNNT